MKVLLAIDSYLPHVDGVINCVHNYSSNLTALDQQVSVMAPRAPRKTPPDDYPYRLFRCGGIYVPIMGGYYGFPRMDRSFRRQVEEESFDIVHAHAPYGMGHYAQRLARSKGIPAIATFHSNIPLIYKDTFKFDFIVRPLVRRLGRHYNQFHEVFVCSPQVAEQLRGCGYTGKITYVPFGTDFEKCDHPDDLAAQANEVFSLDPKELVLVYIGRVMKLKRIDFILRSLKIVKERGQAFRFFVVGEGVDLLHLQHLAKSLGFSDQEVVFTHFLPREHFPLLASRADLLLFPSIYDNFGLVKVECAAYATPGLFIENTCAGDGIVHGQNGYLARDDEASFAGAILEAAADREKLRQAGLNAQETVYFSWRSCAEVLVREYQRIIKEYQEEKK